jgi:hypothetical protein
MSLCLRCDWEGKARHGACPRCGATLYSTAPPRPVPRPSSGVRGRFPRRAATPGASRGETAFGADADGGSGGGGSDASGRRIVVVTLTVMLLVIGSALVVARRGGESPPGPLPFVAPASLAGTLVFARNSSADMVRLWRWDLQADRVAPGPVVPRPDDLVDVRPQPGWVAIVTTTGPRERRIWVVHRLLPDARPVRLNDLSALGGLDPAIPTAVGEGGQPFTLGRVLARSADDALAIAVGRVGDLHGAYEIDLFPEDGVDAPRFLEHVAGPAWGTYTASGVAIVSNGARVVAFSEGSPSVLSAPKDSVQPNGPIAWIP